MVPRSRDHPKPFPGLLPHAARAAPRAPDHGQYDEPHHEINPSGQQNKRGVPRLRRCDEHPLNRLPRRHHRVGHLIQHGAPCQIHAGNLECAHCDAAKNQTQNQPCWNRGSHCWHRASSLLLSSGFCRNCQSPTGCIGVITPAPSVARQAAHPVKRQSAPTPPLHPPATGSLPPRTPPSAPASHSASNSAGTTAPHPRIAPPALTATQTSKPAGSTALVEPSRPHAAPETEPQTPLPPPVESVELLRRSQSPHVGERRPPALPEPPPDRSGETPKTPSEIRAASPERTWHQPFAPRRSDRPAARLRAPPIPHWASGPSAAPSGDPPQPPRHRVPATAHPRPSTNPPHPWFPPAAAPRAAAQQSADTSHSYSRWIRAPPSPGPAETPETTGCRGSRTTAVAAPAHPSRPPTLPNARPHSTPSEKALSSVIRADVLNSPRGLPG